MQTKLTRNLAIAGFVLICVVVLGATSWGAVKRPAAKAATTRAKATQATATPTLRVLNGTSQVARARHAPARLAFSFTVVNVGGATAAHPRAWVEYVAAHRSLTVDSSTLSGLRPGQRKALGGAINVPSHLAGLNWTIEACVSNSVGRSTSSDRTTCAGLGADHLASSHPSTPDSVPSTPITVYTPDRPFFDTDGLGQYENTPNVGGANANSYGGYYTSGYWVDVPRSYDRSNKTPETLLVWLHACQGLAHFDVQVLSTQYSTDRPYIVIAPSGPENAGAGSGPGCWDTSDQTDVKKVLDDISQTETHFNINPRRVILAGYSSGGDLGYLTIFTHADLFAGILAFNTDPVNQNLYQGAIHTAAAAAVWKFPIFQILHTGDVYYPEAQVLGHLGVLRADGFAVSDEVLPGAHYDPPQPADCQDSTPSTCTSGTNYDIGRVLTAQIATDGWEAPAF